MHAGARCGLKSADRFRWTASAGFSHAFAGQSIGIKEVAEKIWLVTFMHYDLGFFDHETGRVECAPNPFQAQVLPMSPV